MPTIDVSVAASADDANELSNTQVTITNTTCPTIDGTGEWVAFRFTGITIPAGATITVAHLALHCPSAGSDDPDTTVFGLDVAAPAQFSVANADISGRTRTTASVTWASADLGAPGTFNTTDMSAIVQELLDTHGPYVAGVMAFAFTSRANDATRDIVVTLFDHTTDPAPALHIEYTEAAGGDLLLRLQGEGLFVGSGGMAA